MALAGCAALNGSTETGTTGAPGSEPPATAETTTAAETETTTATETPPTTAAGPVTGSNGSVLLPGVSDSGLEDATAIVAAHTEGVIDRGAVVTGGRR